MVVVVVVVFAYGSIVACQAIDPGSTPSSHNLCGLQCFDAVDWAAGKASGL